MKTLKLFGFAMIIALAFASCGSEKQATSNKQQTKSKNPFGTTYQTPCAIYDSDTYFAATGISEGSAKQKGVIQQAALGNAQDLVRQKIKHAYKGMVSNFMNSIGNNKGNDVERNMTMAGDQIIDAVVNNTEATCVEWSEVGGDGHIECYVAIKVSKADMAQKIATTVENKLSQDDKLGIKYDEMQYRKQMEQTFKEYKEAN